MLKIKSNVSPQDWRRKKKQIPAPGVDTRFKASGTTCPFSVSITVQISTHAPLLPAKLGNTPNRAGPLACGSLCPQPFAQRGASVELTPQIPSSKPPWYLNYVAPRQPTAFQLFLKRGTDIQL